MSVQPIPAGYHTVTPYVLTDDVDGLVNFLTAAFSAVVHVRAPGADGRTRHADVTIGDSHVMLAQAPGRPCMLHLYVPDTDAAYAQAMAAGATSEQEPTDMFYGDRNAGVKDPAGNSWWMATHIEDVSDEELAERARTQIP